jgi:sn-glycerol 3-phosphate transport system ATP-binding protein
MKAEFASVSAPNAVTLGVRPEHLQITDTNPRMQGHVLYTEALGAETLIHLKLSDETLVTVRQNASESHAAEGADVGITWSDVDQMLFDGAGKRI